MFTQSRYSPFLLGLCVFALHANAAEHTHHGVHDDHAGHAHHVRAPIGVSGDHIHRAGEAMITYRYMSMRMEDLRSGSSRISNADAFAAGYGRVPTEMQMNMHMLGFMYAPSDAVTLMLMTHYGIKDMDMVSSPMGMGHGMSMHGSHTGTQHRHETEGWGDTVLGGLLRVASEGTTSLHVGLGVGLPTAEVDKRMNGVLQPYGMQLGTGVWDLRPSVTTVHSEDGWTLGAQGNARVSLEAENDAGFRPGDSYGVTAWIVRSLMDGISASVRTSYRHTGSLRRRYNAPQMMGSPNTEPSNYGGTAWTYGVGLEFSPNRGPLSGQRIALEYLAPLEQDVNGIQLGLEHSVVLGWQSIW